MAAAASRLAAALVLTTVRLALAENDCDSDDFFCDDFWEKAQDVEKWTGKHWVVALALAAFVVFCLPILICKCLGKMLCEAVELVVCCPCRTLKCLCCGGSKSRGLELEDSDEDDEDEDTQEEQLVNRDMRDISPSTAQGPPASAGAGALSAPTPQGAAVFHQQLLQAQQMQMMHHQQLLHQQHYAHQQAAAVHQLRATGAPAPAYHYAYPGQQQQVMYTR